MNIIMIQNVFGAKITNIRRAGSKTTIRRKQ